MNGETILIVRPNPFRGMRKDWWRYALMVLLLFGVLKYREVRDGPPPTGRTPIAVSIMIFGTILVPVLGLQILISRCWYTSISHAGLDVHEPFKALRKIAWTDIKTAEVIHFESDSYIEFTVSANNKPLTMPLPECTVELKQLFSQHAGTDNPIFKALTENEA